MKKLLLFIAILSVLLAKSQTSVYHPFPDSNAYWNFHTYLAMCPIGGYLLENYSLLISGDTIIGSKTYHKLVTPYVQYSLSGLCSQHSSPGYKGAIRQDIDNKKVFFVPPSHTNEELLYDFTMEVGDTVKGYLETWDYPPDTVIWIDSILIGENFRKMWVINTNYQIYLIEGIGSTYGLLKHSPGNMIDASDYSLTCFSQNGQSIYPYSSSTCQLITSTADLDFTPNAVQIFPNPSYGSFTIDFGVQKDISEIWITNMIGNIVFYKKIINQQNVSVTNLPSGAYILTIVDNEGRTINKKIISYP